MKIKKKFAERVQKWFGGAQGASDELSSDEEVLFSVISLKYAVGLSFKVRKRNIEIVT